MSEQRTSKIQLYRCQCGGAPRTQLMGTMICDRCGNYREDRGQPWPTEERPSNLVADLRELGAIGLEGSPMQKTCNGGAAEIERLTAECEAARSEARALKSAFDTSVALQAKLRAALTWALEQGIQAVSWGSGFMHRQEYELEPPAEIDAVVREVRREILKARAP